MTYKDTYKLFLEKHPKARDRKFKNEATATLLKLKFVELEKIPLDRVADYITAILGWDRSWRLLMSENKEWQTESYQDKEILEQEEQLALGYTPNFHQDVKKLNTI